MKTAHKLGLGTGAAAVIAVTVGFLPAWEGTDHVAKRDRIGTGHPITWCHGQTTADDPTVKVGQRFTDKQCDEYLAASLPKYLASLDKCIKVPLPSKSVAALLDASYNAGAGAVCKSPMLAHMNAGNVRDGCNAFNGWYVRSDGQVRAGLIDRRAGELHGDHRKSERALCLEGLSEPKTTWYTGSNISDPPAEPKKRDGKPGTRPDIMPVAPTDPNDKYSCFGAGRYAAMEAGRECPPAKHWWQK